MFHKSYNGITVISSFNKFIYITESLHLSLIFPVGDMANFLRLHVLLDFVCFSLSGHLVLVLWDRRIISSVNTVTNQNDK